MSSPLWSQTETTKHGMPSQRFLVTSQILCFAVSWYNRGHKILGCGWNLVGWSFANLPSKLRGCIYLSSGHATLLFTTAGLPCLLFRIWIVQAPSLFTRPDFWWFLLFSKLKQYKGEPDMMMIKNWLQQ